MSMSKKDYELIARIIATMRIEPDRASFDAPAMPLNMAVEWAAGYNVGRMEALEELTERLKEALALDNPMFQPSRFEKATRQVRGV